ncbi:MAG: DUF2085 domain-containing protein [Thermoplasmata archaeon]
MKIATFNKGPFIFFLLASFYTLSLFIAPFTLEPGTVENLDGNANMIDYMDRWDDMSPYHSLIYTFSDFNCHQKSSRSYYINENQMPVCARDVGIFTGMSIGLFIMMFIQSRRDYKDIILDLLHINKNYTQGRKSWIIVILGLITVLPMALDGGIQLVTSYESTNPLRTITGLLFGFGFSVFICSLILSSLHDIKFE